MAGFVAGFNVDKDEIILLQGLDGRLRLPLIICIVETCGAFYIDGMQAGIASDASNQVHRRNDCTAVNLRPCG